VVACCKWNAILYYLILVSYTPSSSIMPSWEGFVFI
jgi:hypothetical protein